MTASGAGSRARIGEEGVGKLFGLHGRKRKLP